ncbi:MAG: phosphoribosylglycinamide formyltransferase [Phycisphaeraceae bacterium]
MAEANPKTSQSNPQDSRRPRLAVALSGGGTTLLNLHDRINAGTLHAEIACVVASNDHCKGVERAKQRDFPVHVLPRKTYPDKHAFSDSVFNACREFDADLLILAGFLSLLVIPDDFANRVLNIHPSLLPKFGGKGMHGHHVHQAVIDANETTSGCTVHLADNTYDTGPPLLQKTCPVLPGDSADTLADRVFDLECEAYPQAIADHWQQLQNHKKS